MKVNYNTNQSVPKANRGVHGLEIRQAMVNKKDMADSQFAVSDASIES